LCFKLSCLCLCDSGFCRFKYLKAEDEAGQLADVVASLAEYWKTGKEFEYLIDHTVVCAKFWEQATGLSSHKIRKARKAVYSGTKVFAHGNAGRVPQSNQKQAVLCTTFWKHFFTELAPSAAKCEINLAEQHLSRHEVQWLFPTSRTTPSIFHEDFKPWLARLFPKEVCPCYSTFQRAREDPEFSNVSVRAKHTHALCTKCAQLTAARAAGFARNEDIEQHKMDMEAHRQDCQAWYYYIIIFACILYYHIAPHYITPTLYYIILFACICVGGPAKRISMHAVITHRGCLIWSRRTTLVPWDVLILQIENGKALVGSTKCG
jgi:hypothetical protein